MREIVQTCDPDLPTGRLIHVLSHQLKRYNALEAEIIGLTPMQTHVLKHILMTTMCRDIYQRDIEKEFEIRRPTATGLLKLLEKNGFIIRESVSDDARLKRIIPTKKAEALRVHILKNVKEMEAKLVAGIPDQELSACRNVMWRMFLNIRMDEGRQEAADKTAAFRDNRSKASEDRGKEEIV